MMAASAEERAECSLIQKLETLATLGQFDEIEIWLNRFIEFRRRAWSEGVFSADPHLKNYGVIGKRIVLLDFGGLTMDLKVVEDHLQETNGHRRPDQRLRLEKILEKRPDIAGRFNANWDNLMQLSVVRDAWQNGAGQKSHAAPPTAPATFTILNHPLEPEDIQKASPAIAYLEALQTNFDLQATSMRASLDSGQNISDGISALIALTFDKALMQQREAIGGNFFLIVGNLLNPISIALQEAQEVMMGKKTVPSELRGYLLKQLSAFATSLTRAIQTYHHAAAALGSAA
jgi:hypothetical protein